MSIINYLQLSKEISYALRHAPWEYELELDDDGFKTKFYAGESTRPYVENGTTLLTDEIMKTKSPIPDPGGIPNGLRWDVPGSFAGKEGVWELVVNKDINTIVHFLFNSK